MTQPIKTALSLLPLAGYLVFLVLLAYSKPLYTWDTVPYTATILSADISDPQLLHSRTYAYLKSSMTPQQYASVTSGPYAADLESNADHFIGQLDMYRIKPAYVIALRTLTALGAEPLTSLRLLSVIPGILLCLLLFVWLSRSCSTLSAALIVVVFAVVSRLADLSRVPVPDNLSALIILAALYALANKRWLGVAVLLLVASICVRTNNILFAGLVLLWQSWSAYAQDASIRSPTVLLFTGGLVVSSALYFTINGLFDYSWWRLFYHTFVESQVDIPNFAAPFSIEIYWAVVHSAILQVVASGATISTSMPFFVLLLILCLQGKIRRLYTEALTPRALISLPHISLLCLPLFAAFLVLFPLVQGWDRFFLPFYALITVVAAEHLTLWHEKATQNDPKSL